MPLKEMRESNYWFKVLNGTLQETSLKTECKNLVRESEELKKILGSICAKTERKKSINQSINQSIKLKCIKLSLNFLL